MPNEAREIIVRMGIQIRKLEKKFDDADNEIVRGFIEIDAIKHDFNKLAERLGSDERV